MQFLPPFWYLGPAVSRAMCSPSLTADAWILPQAILCGICSGQSVTVKSLFPSISFLHCHRHSVSAQSTFNIDVYE